jgi:predicted DNA-binding transcriptional regulator AlpA
MSNSVVTAVVGCPHCGATGPANTYLTEAETAQLTRFAPGTLANMRCQGRGPRFTHVGKAIRYKREDVIAWMEKGTSR